MNNKELMRLIADVHNTITEIKVSGDDVFRMASALDRLRGIVKELAVYEETQGEKNDQS